MVLGGFRSFHVVVPTDILRIFGFGKWRVVRGNR